MVLTAELGLKGLRATHGRWEELAASSEQEARFQLITMRAVRLESEHLARLAQHLLRPGGIFAWWGGPESKETARVLCENEFSGLQTLGSFQYALPRMTAERSVWMWKKEG